MPIMKLGSLIQNQRSSVAAPKKVVDTHVKSISLATDKEPPKNPPTTAIAGGEGEPDKNLLPVWVRKREESPERELQEKTVNSEDLAKSTENDSSVNTFISTTNQTAEEAALDHTTDTATAKACETVETALENVGEAVEEASTDAVETACELIENCIDEL